MAVHENSERPSVDAAGIEERTRTCSPALGTGIRISLGPLFPLDLCYDMVCYIILCYVMLWQTILIMVIIIIIVMLYHVD